MAGHPQNASSTDRALDKRVVNLEFGTSQFDTWAGWFERLARSIGVTEYRVYRDNEDPAWVGVFFTVDAEDRGKRLAQEILVASDGVVGLESARLVALFRKG